MRRAGLLGCARNASDIVPELVDTISAVSRRMGASRGGRVFSMLIARHEVGLRYREHLPMFQANFFSRVGALGGSAVVAEYSPSDARLDAVSRRRLGVRLRP